MTNFAILECEEIKKEELDTIYVDPVFAVVVKFVINFHFSGICRRNHQLESDFNGKMLDLRT